MLKRSEVVFIATQEERNAVVNYYLDLGLKCWWVNEPWNLYKYIHTQIKGELHARSTPYHSDVVLTFQEWAIGRVSLEFDPAPERELLSILCS